MKLFLICTLISLLGVIIGCSDDPNQAVIGLGLGLISPDDTLTIEHREFTATFDTTLLSRITGTQTTIIGKSQNLESRALLQFSGFSAIPPNAQIDSAVLNITLNYKFMDSSGVLGFSVHELLASWDEKEFTWDSSLKAGLYKSTPALTNLSNINAEDIILTFRLDDLVRQWVQAEDDQPNGIILLPDPISTNMIVGSINKLQTSTKPVLSVAYRDTSDTTIIFQPNLTQQISVSNNQPSLSSSRMLIQAGVAYHSLLRFDTLSFPPRVSILQATLVLYADDNSSKLNMFSRDSILAFLLRKNTPPYDSLALGTVCSPSMNGTQKVYSADIKTIVQQWVTQEPNYGIILRPFGEFTTLDRFVIYGSTAQSALRPKLTITYTILP